MLAHGYLSVSGGKDKDVPQLLHSLFTKESIFFFFQSAKGGLQFGFTLVSWFFGGFTVSTSFKLPSSVTVGKNSSSKLSMVDTDPVSLLAN